MSDITMWDNGRLELELVDSDSPNAKMRLTIVGHDQTEDDTVEGAKAILERLDEHARCIAEVSTVVRRGLSSLKAREATS